MPTVPGVLRFDIDSSLDTPADGFTAELAGAVELTGLYSLPHGLLDPLGNEVLAAHVASGRIIERRIIGTADERRTYVRGLDKLADTFKIQRAIRYVPDPPTEPIDAAENADLGITVKVGTWTAKDIAVDLAVGTGLTINWHADVRDYTFRQTFDGTGTFYDLLRRLVEPWEQAPLGTDITVIGTVVHIRPRLLHPPPDLTLTVADSGLVDVEVSLRRELPYIGLVVLEGRPEGFQFFPGDPPFPSPTTVVVPYSYPVYDTVGTLVSLVDGERTYRMPDNLLLEHVQREYQTKPGVPLTQVKQESTTTTYEASTYGPEGPRNQPLPLKAVKSVQTLQPAPSGVGAPVAPGTMLLMETLREEVVWKYDERRFLRATTTQRFKRTSTGTPPVVTFPEVERIEETRTDKLPGWLEVATTRTTLDPATGKVTGSVTLQAQDQAGLPPGGIRPPLAHVGIPGGGTPQPGRITERISTDPTAVPVRYSNGNLTRDDLDYIMDRLRQVSGLDEWGLRASGPAIPDLMKGSGIHLTGFVDDLGAPTLIDPAQIRRIAFAYQDTREVSEYTCRLEAVFYRPRAA